MWSQVGLRKHHYDKASGGDGIPVELFQILKDDAVKVLHSICQQIWKIQQWPQDWKRSVFIPFPKKGNAEECWGVLHLYSSVILSCSFLFFVFSLSGFGIWVMVASWNQFGSVPSWAVFWKSFRRIDIQFSSVSQSCPTLCNPMDCSMPGLPVHRQLPEFTQTHVHWLSDAIQPSHPLLSPSPPVPNPSQHQSLFQWVNSLHEVAKVLEFQLQHQSFQWIFRTGFL